MVAEMYMLFIDQTILQRLQVATIQSQNRGFVAELHGNKEGAKNCEFFINEFIYIYFRLIITNCTIHLKT